MNFKSSKIRKSASVDFDNPSYYKEDTAARLDFSNIVAALYRNSKFIMIFAILGLLAGFFFTVNRDPVYVANSVVVLQPENSTLDFLEISEKFTTNRSTVETQLDVFKSTELLGNVIDRISEKHQKAGYTYLDSKKSLPNVPREEQIEWLSNIMVVGRKGESLALTILVRAAHPILAAELANEIGQTYIDRKLQQKQSEIVLATDILKQRTTELGNKLTRNERTLAELVQTKQLNDLELDTRLRARVAQLKAQRDSSLPETEENRERLTLLAEQIKTIEGDLVERTLATIRKEELIREIETDRLRHDQVFEQLLRIETESMVMSPGAQLVSAANAPLKPTGLSAKTAAVLGFVSASFFAILVSLFLAAFDRRIRTTDQIENLLEAPCLATVPMQSYEEADVNPLSINSIQDLFSNNIRKYPQWKDIALKANPTEIDKDATEPLYGGDPWEPHEPIETAEPKFHKLMQNGNRSIFAMSVRKLFFNLDIRLPKEKGITIGITSALPNEGKSTIATSLAFAASIKKQRIAVVDFDMWHHGVDFLANVDDKKIEDDTLLVDENINEDKTPSLEDWFTKSAKLNEIRTKVDGFETVDIYPWVIKNHDEYIGLDESKIHKLFKALRAEYDLIIVDTAPFMLVSEISIITSELDGFLVVVAWEDVTDRVLLDLKKAMDLANVDIIGCVLNRIDPKKQKHYGLGDYLQYYKGPDGYA